MAQMMWFTPRTVLSGLWWWVTLFGEMCPKNPPDRGVNKHFEAKLPKSKICNISETVHPISPKCGNEIPTVNGTSWVVRTWNKAWLTSAILKNWHIVIARTPMVRFTQKLMCRCKMGCWWRLIGQSGNRKYNFNMATVRFPKPEVIITQPWIEISSRNLVIKFVCCSDMETDNLTNYNIIFIVLWQ